MSARRALLYFGGTFGALYIIFKAITPDDEAMRKTLNIPKDQATETKRKNQLLMKQLGLKTAEEKSDKK